MSTMSLGQNGSVSTLSVGEVFAGCRIEAIAGRGGMGVVYRAVQLELGRPVALKLIAADRATDAEFRERFQRESRLAAAIDHPNIVPVHSAGEYRGRLYLVMRYVSGSDLHALLKREGRLAPERAAAIAAQIGAALDAAHAAGLVHRDVKPANVLLDGEHAYLGDFGLTRLLDSDTELTSAGQWLGTVDFSSPEQIRGGRLDARADIYSLGCVLHAMLTGSPPFPRGTVPATVLAHAHDAPPRPSEQGLPSGFDRVMARALAKAPADRYPSGGDLGRAALAAARGEPVTESERSVAVGSAAPATAPTVVIPPETRIKPAPPPAPRQRRRRRRALPVLLLLGVAALAAAAVFIGIPGRDAAGTTATGTALSADEAGDVAKAFASAYEDEDGRAIGLLLTRDAQRFLPGGVARGRAKIVTEYERQFRAQETRGYELDDLDVQGGRAGRVSGSYRVTRAGDPAIEGRIVFGVVRDRGRPRIALIAITPSR